MSNQARRILALGVCLTIGLVALFESVRRLNADSATGAILIGVAMFFLLSAVGLARPWLGRGVPRRGPRHR